MVLAGRPVASDRRLAARPVGEASAYLFPAASAADNRGLYAGGLSGARPAREHANRRG
jgi:hypothetical protein